MTRLNPYAAPQAHTSLSPLASREWRGHLENQNRVAWGATLCLWGYLALLVFGYGSRLMMLLNSSSSLENFYYETSHWGGWVASAALQLVGLFLLCSIGEQTGSKRYFQLAFACFVADQGWQLLPYLDEVQDIPPSVRLLAHAIALLAQLFCYLALRRVSHYCQDQQMQRWATWALRLYLVIFLLNISTEAMYFFEIKPILSLGLHLGDTSYSFDRLQTFVQGLLALPLLYFYPRLMKRLAFWWEQVPVAELAQHDPTIQTGASHEPESV